MPHAPHLHQKRPPSEDDLRRLGILKTPTAACCKHCCQDPWCRRTRRCRALERLERRFDLADGIDYATAIRIINGQRGFLGKPPLGER